MYRAARQHLESPWFHLVMLLLLALLALLARPASAASSVLIWPINPVIEAEQKAVALWLENRGQAPVNLQVRVMNWQQSGFEDRLDAQREVIGSPPVVTIAPGKRQMIRLMAMQAPQPGVQQAYRVLIDEMLDNDAAADPQLGVKFQMRYSIPLFVFGAGAAPEGGQDQGREGLKILAPQLSYRVQQQGPVRYLLVRNDGSAHARLSAVRFTRSGQQQVVAEGLLGYVLPGAEMRWPLPAGVNGGGAALQAMVNDRSESSTITGH